MCHDARRSCGDESFVSWEGQEKDLSTSLTVRWSRKRKRWESDNAVFWNDRKTKWSCRSSEMICGLFYISNIIGPLTVQWAVPYA